jgi:hypothetical protein
MGARPLTLLLILALNAAAARALAGEVGLEIETLASQADAAGLPGDRLRQKAREGLAKGVPNERIVIVVTAMRVQMYDVAALLSGIAGAKLESAERRGLVGTLTAALQGGIAREVLTELSTEILPGRGTELYRR